MEIKNSYLMWVGVEHYEDAETYLDEVRKLGVSKRLPGVGMANALTEPGTVVFVAHDDGEAYSCDSCMGMVECGECRVLDGKIAKWEAEAAEVKKRFKGEEIPRGKQRIIDIREARIAKARAEKESCEVCDGEGQHECGTGGQVMRRDGSKMDYRTFNYWLRQPKRFNPDREVIRREGDMCEDCGGTGKVPAAKIFGVFIPTDVEYILSGKENELVLEQIEDFKKLTMEVVKKEPKRKCGKRRPGYYVTTAKNKKSKKAVKDLIDDLAAKGMIKKSETEVIGDFVAFTRPVEAQNLKRFRGVKKFALIPEAEDQAQAILDAVGS